MCAAVGIRRSEWSARSYSERMQPSAPKAPSMDGAFGDLRAAGLRLFVDEQPDPMLYFLVALTSIAGCSPVQHSWEIVKVPTPPGFLQ